MLVVVVVAWTGPWSHLPDYSLVRLSVTGTSSITQRPYASTFNLNPLSGGTSILVSWLVLLALLRPGGTLFLLVPAHPFLHSSFDTEAGHYRRYTKRALGALHETAGTAPLDVRQFYFNAVGAIGYFVQYKLLRKQPRADSSAEIGWFDRIVVPVMRRLERERAPFGISLVAVLTKRA